VSTVSLSQQYLNLRGDQKVPLEFLVLVSDHLNALRHHELQEGTALCRRVNHELQVHAPHHDNHTLLPPLRLQSRHGHRQHQLAQGNAKTSLPPYKTMAGDESKWPSNAPPTYKTGPGASRAPAGGAHRGGAGRRRGQSAIPEEEDIYNY
jgi:hypothetical protein